jgi:hypothetical protein
MLAFHSPQDLDSSLDAMRSIGVTEDYLQQILHPALLRGEWGELEKMVVYQDEKKTILFGDDVWAFSESACKADGICNIYFNVEPTQGENVIELRHAKHHLINQTKCLALASMWFSVKHIKIVSIKGKINILRGNIAQLIKHGVTSFEDLNQEKIEYLIDSECFDLSKAGVFKGLNMLCDLNGTLPFNVNFSPLTHKLFNSRPDEVEGKLVIPPRIYFEALTTYSKDIVKAYELRDEIEKAVELATLSTQKNIANQILSIRNGTNIYTPKARYKKQWGEFINSIKNADVPLIDKGEDPRWMQIFESLQVHVSMSNNAYKYFKANIGGVSYGFTALRRYLTKLSAKAEWLCLALSGMRVDEFHKISPVYGAQKMTFDKNGYESDTGKEIIYFLSARQSKITLNSQTKNDTFVTTEVGWKAFHVLNAIHTPLRNRFAVDERHRMFAVFTDTQYCRPVQTAGLGKFIKENFNNDNFDLTLTADDMGYLQASDPNQTCFKQGDIFHFTPHQTRRSLAYYLIGYELCSFPALKQQLSHLSLAMTRWYARNAYSFEKLYSEIQNERISQKAEIFARVYNKMANGERIAGGKGQAMINEISREGESYFEDGINKRKLSVDYWIEQLTKGKTHLHAIAPGMYCTNTQCSMRINIDLSECVDCDYDYIENAVYAESSRMDAMRNIEFLRESNELNSSAATKFFMQVKAAEAIMDDLAFKHDKYVFSEDVLSLVINTKAV